MHSAAKAGDGGPKQSGARLSCIGGLEVGPPGVTAVSAGVSSVHSATLGREVSALTAVDCGSVVPSVRSVLMSKFQAGRQG